MQAWPLSLLDITRSVSPGPWQIPANTPSAPHGNQNLHMQVGLRLLKQESSLISFLSESGPQICSSFGFCRYIPKKSNNSLVPLEISFYWPDFLTQFHVFIAWLAMRRSSTSKPTPMGVATQGLSDQWAVEMLGAEWQPIGRQDAAECSGLQKTQVEVQQFLS